MKPSSPVGGTPVKFCRPKGPHPDSPLFRKATRRDCCWRAPRTTTVGTLEDRPRLAPASLTLQHRHVSLLHRCRGTKNPLANFLRAREVIWRRRCLVHPTSRRSIRPARLPLCAISMPRWACEDRHSSARSRTARGLRSRPGRR